MKIIQVQTQAEAAGAQRISDMVGEGLRAAGHEVTTVFMYRKTAVYDDLPHVDFVLKHPPRGLLDQVRACWGLLAYLRRQKPEAVLCYQYYGVAFGALGAWLAGARHIVANQSGAPQKRGMLGFMSLIDRLYGTIGLYHYSVVNSSWTQAQFESYPGGYRGRLRRIDHGVHVPDTRQQRDAARARFGLPPAAPMAISSGRITADKNQIALVRALEVLPDLHVALAGIGPDTDRIVAFAQQTGVSGRLHLLGEIPPSEIYAFLAAGDVYVFPSRFETFGLAVVEAAIAGLPVIANDIPVLREVLQDDAGQAAALFVDAENPAKLAEAIRLSLSGAEGPVDPGAVRRNLARRYSPQKMSRAYGDLLELPRQGQSTFG